MEMRAPKGVFDIYPGAKDRWQDSNLWQFVESILREHAQIFNFKEIRTPIFEHLELFNKGVGEGSDIVSKEMYSFLDKGGRELALRPEGTAAVLRAYIENKIYAADKTSKLFYIAPMFRYERQQAGRYRQHHQFGAEVLGVCSPYQDVEIIDMALDLYKKLGLRDLKLLINCVGSVATRQAYSHALKAFLEPKYEVLSADSKLRFHKNMLRILDSKDLKDQALLEGCPNILDYLDEEKQRHFNTVLENLTSLGISYEVSPKLVRGLDYYDSTVFEIVMPHEDSFLTLGGGGRYDGLISSYTDQSIPAVGFGTGIERIIQTLLLQQNDFGKHPELDAYIIPMSQSGCHKGIQLAHKLRNKSLRIDIDLLGRKMKAAIPYATSLGARYVIFIGEDEIVKGTYKIKNLHSRNEIELNEDALIEYISNRHI